MRRNKTYSLYPRLLLGLLLAVLAWAVLRSNVSAEMGAQFPWRIVVLDAGTAASLAGGLGALIFARNQFAMSVRPYLGFSIMNRPAQSILPTGEITAALFNSGQGVAKFDSVDYSLRLRDCQYDSSDEWLDYHSVLALLNNLGLRDGEHFGLLWLGGGRLPFTSRESSIELLSLRREFLDILELFDIRIRFSDTIGDRHQVVLGCIRQIPKRFYTS